MGHIITTVNASYDPNKLFKNQTWVRFANGRTLVGVDDSDTSFDAVEKTGGKKTVKLTESRCPHIRVICTQIQDPHGAEIQLGILALIN